MGRVAAAWGARGFLIGGAALLTFPAGRPRLCSRFGNESYEMWEHDDFSVVVKNRANSPKPWRWEIYRAGRNSLKIFSANFGHPRGLPANFRFWINHVAFCDVYYWPITDIASCAAHVCYWPLADMLTHSSNVRSRGKADIGNLLAQSKARLGRAAVRNCVFACVLQATLDRRY